MTPNLFEVALLMRDLEKYYKSISKELYVIKDRVRNLIGNANWGEEGRYKEAILSNVIKRFLPTKFSVGTGFIVTRSWISKQIDLIIYDNTYPLLFSEGTFIITIPESVKAIIEVKTNLENRSLKNTLIKINENTKRTDKAKVMHSGLFNGIFSYDGYTKFERCTETLDKIFCEPDCQKNIFNIDFDSQVPDSSVKDQIVNHISFNENLLLKYSEDYTEKKYTLYQIPDLSFTYFILNIIQEIGIPFIPKEQSIWIPGEKETINKRDFIIWKK